MKVKEKSEKADLKFNIPKTKIMASGPITSWQIDGKTMETVIDFARVQLQQPGIQPEEVNGVSEWDSLSVFYGLPLYSKFKILF